MCTLVYKEHGQIACATSLLRGTAACSFSGQGCDCLPDLCVMPASSPTQPPLSAMLCGLAAFCIMHASCPCPRSHEWRLFVIPIIQYALVRCQLHRHQWAAWCRVGINMSAVEVRFENLSVEADVHVGGRALPTVLNSILNFVEVGVQ